MNSITPVFPELRPSSGLDPAALPEPSDQHRPRRTLRLTIVLTVILVTALAIDQILRSGYFTIERVQVDSALQRVHRGLVERATWRNINGNYLSVDLRAVESALEEVPGVYQAVIRRIWPDTLAVSITETGAMARFVEITEGVTSDEYINLPPSSPLQTVPVLRAQASDRQWLVNVFMQILPALRDAQLQPLSLSFTPAGRWDLELQPAGATPNTHFALLLGRDEITNKVSRFASSYAIALHPRKEMISQVDMRYTNGFAVRWRDGATASQVQLAGLSRNTD